MILFGSAISTEGRRGRGIPGVIALLVGQAALLGLAGCAEDPREATGLWTEPAWFAEQAREREEVTQILQDCMHARGWDFPVDEYGGIEANLAEVPDSDRVVADIDACYAEIPAEYRVEVDADYLHDFLYLQQVDTYHCLLAHGVAPDPPPPVDVFVETHLADHPSDVWIAWQSGWVTQYLSQGHDQTDLAELERECPQPYVAP